MLKSQTIKEIMSELDGMIAEEKLGLGDAGWLKDIQKEQDKILRYEDAETVVTSFINLGWELEDFLSFVEYDIRDEEDSEELMELFEYYFPK